MCAQFAWHGHNNSSLVSLVLLGSDSGSTCCAHAARTGTPLPSGLAQPGAAQRHPGAAQLSCQP
eukprot:487455-Alexandrium_andersonii.AAC.1